MVGNIGIGISNAIGFKHIINKGGGGGGSISYPGLIAAWSAKGKSNDDEDRAILKDLTGNGHDITLNGFAFSEMSGYGGYNFRNHNGKSVFNNVRGWQTLLETRSNKKIKFKISGIQSLIDGTGYGINVVKFTEADNIEHFTEIKQDGEYELQSEYGFRIRGNGSTSTVDNQIIIEEIPEYPDALVFDGVDDYGINEDMPILTDYTLIVKRNNFGDLTTLKNGIISKRERRSDTFGAFMFEKDGTWNFGYKNNNIPVYEGDITYQTSSEYNNININKGTSIDTTIITIGAGYYFLDTNVAGELSKMAFYSAYLFNRSLDEQEIKSFIRKYIDPEYLLPSEIPTPDCYYDFSQGSNDDETRDTIKDLSGNGNDAVAHNFAWNEEGSGYKDGALYFDGVDDYISLDAFDSGFKTIFMVCRNFTNKQCFIYDQRTLGLENFAIRYDANQIAYISRSNTNPTYINGKLNNTLKHIDLLNKKHLININSATYNASGIICNIGAQRTNNNNSTNMALYKFLGFKEALTEEQINAIIKKYNLLDGVGEIEVS